MHRLVASLICQLKLSCELNSPGPVVRALAVVVVLVVLAVPGGGTTSTTVVLVTSCVVASVGGISSITSVVSSVVSRVVSSVVTASVSCVVASVVVASIVSSVVVPSIVASIVASVVAGIVSSIVSCVTSITITSSVVTSTCHLNRNDTTKWASSSRVLATDHADIALASNIASALLVGGNSSNKRMVSGVASVVTATLVTVNILGNLDVLPGLRSAVRVDHASIRTGTVRINLMKGHGDLTTRRNLGERSTVLRQNSLSATLNIVCTSSNGLADTLGSLATEASSILLEGIATSAVTGSRRDDSKSGARATSIANSVGDDAVARNKLGGQDGSGSEDSFERHCGGGLMCGFDSSKLSNRTEAKNINAVQKPGRQGR